MTTRPLGVFQNMPFDEYLAVDAVSASGLKVFARSAWHYKNRIDTEPTPSMLRGTLAHCAVLEPDAMSQRYAVTPADAPRRPSRLQWQAKSPSEESKAAMRWWTDFAERNAGKSIIDAEQFALCQAQLAAVSADPELAKLLRFGQGEVSLFWVDKATGLYCKARPDWLTIGTGEIIHSVDLKTCADESPNGFGRAAARLRYDLQEAHYRAGIQATTRMRVDQFVFAAVSNKPPVLAVPYALTDEIRDNAIEERRELMQRMAWCYANDQWPAYGQGLQPLDFPAWAKAGGEVEVEWSEEA